MNPSSGSIEAFYLDCTPGQRFCIFFSPPILTTCNGSVLYVAPFAEEMNKSRHLAAEQARMLAAHGYAVLLIDLYGCGDSSGDFGDARWSIWKNDLLQGTDWLLRHVGAPISLLGVRLGALLAVDVANTIMLQRSDITIQKLVFWQPALEGANYLTQFLRFRLAADVLSSSNSAINGSNAIRQRLQQGESIEIAGYLLSSDLAKEIEMLDARPWKLEKLQVHWLECIHDKGGEIAPSRQKLIDDWHNRGANLQVTKVICEPFWASSEIDSAPSLISTSTRIFCDAEKFI